MDKKISANEIIQNTNIVDVVSSYLSLKQKGKNYWGICPFHNDSQPSMSVSNEKGLFKCFSCQAGGNVVVFLTRFNKWNFVEAIKYLAELQGVQPFLSEVHTPKIVRNEYEIYLLEVLKDAMHVFSYLLFDSKDQNLKNYLTRRHLSIDLIKRFEIGYASENYLDMLKRKGHQEDVLISASLATEENFAFFKNRLVFTIRNSQGDIVGFSGRTLDPNAKSAKYINSSESSLFNKSEIFYNYNLAKNAIDFAKEIIIVEGFMDVIAYYRDGIENVVAIMGTALTEKHLPLIKKNKVILSFDGDRAGIAATTKSLLILLKYKIEAFVLINKTSLDPDEMLQKNGLGTLKDYVTNAKMQAVEFLYQVIREKLDLDDFESVQQFRQEFSKILNYIDSAKQNFYIEKVARDLNLQIVLKQNYYPEHNQKDFLERKSFDPNQRYQKFQNNFSNSQSDPFLTIEDKYQKNKTFREQLLIKIILLLLKNPNFFEMFNPNQVLWQDLDQKIIVENLANLAQQKTAVELNEKQQKMQLDLENFANTLTKYEYSNNYDDFQEILERVNYLTREIAINSDLLHLPKNHQKEIVDNLNKNIKKQNKFHEKN